MTEWKAFRIWNDTRFQCFLDNNPNIHSYIKLIYAQSLDDIDIDE